MTAPALDLDGAVWRTVGACKATASSVACLGAAGLKDNHERWNVCGVGVDVHGHVVGWGGTGEGHPPIPRAHKRVEFAGCDSGMRWDRLRRRDVLGHAGMGGGLEWAGVCLMWCEKERAGRARRGEEGSGQGPRVMPLYADAASSTGVIILLFLREKKKEYF